MLSCFRVKPKLLGVASGFSHPKQVNIVGKMAFLPELWINDHKLLDKEGHHNRVSLHDSLCL